ncbi:MAG: beta-propeller fold lactonase family protein [Planctomycetes bacterium]|nr:beta-propeller fold lactonase family protein [Planctomycetota bacterium]
MIFANLPQGGGGGGQGSGGGGGGSQHDTANVIGTFLNFEAPQVHPIVVSDDGARLYAVDTADARVSIFDLTQPGSPKLLTEIAVGIEPVSVRARTSDEIWVVNHTSDSVSVISISSGVVTDTIACKDEPCDVVFAGTPARAYVSSAGAKTIQVFDAATHALITNIPVLGVQPRSLAVSGDGTKVYASITLSGNRSTVIPASMAPPQPPPTNPAFGPPPQTGLIVSSTDPLWAGSIPYTVSDNDVAVISTASNTVTNYYTDLGTVNFAIGVQPTTGNIFVANTDSHNVTRFEPNVRGHAVDNQVVRIAAADGTVTKFDLNPGISYANPNNPAALALALAQPTDLVFLPDGSALYVASFGTDRVAKMDPASGNILARIEVGNTPGTLVDSRNKRGPRGLAMHPGAGFLYVMNRISNTIGTINITNSTLVAETAVSGYDPTPLAIRTGRGFLYDAKLSGNGTMSCATCHIDSDTDREDWDLGDPDGAGVSIPDPANIYGISFMHPEKGPMFTQTLKGLSQGSNPLHWRGDRSSFLAFSAAFQTLLGGTALNATDMQAFSDFILTCNFESNPNLALDRTLPLTLNGANPTNGMDLYINGSATTPIGACNSCHHLPLGTGSKIVNKTVLGQEQGLKVPQLRTNYQKVDFNNAPGAMSLAGFGLSHDGAFSSIQGFLSNPVTFGALASDAAAQNDIASFCLCIDTNTAPAVGYSRTVNASNAASAGVTSDLATLIARAELGEIDLIAKGLSDGVIHGFLYVPLAQRFQSDQSSYGPFILADLIQKAQSGSVITFMGVPKGSGQRMGIDRNLNGVPDYDEANLIFLEDFGTPTPACAGNVHLVSNSQPLVGNSDFAFMCNNVSPNNLALVLISSGLGIKNGVDFYGMTLWIDLNATELYALDMVADDLGFGFAPVAIPNNPNLKGNKYAAMVITLNPCAPFGVAGSQGAKFKIN